MRKELIVAVLLGSVLGLVVAFAIWRTNTAIKTNSVNNSPNTTQTNNTSVTAASSAELTILAPSNNSVSTNSQLQVQGITKPDTLIPIFAESKDYLIKADSSGNFSVDVELIGGINNLLIDGKNVTVVYSGSLGEPPTSATPAPNATDEIRQKIQEKIEVSSKPTALMGIVTDKTANSIQVRDSEGQIQQVAISPDSTYIRMAKTTTDTDFDDLGIGDYIAALGWASPSSGLTALRVIITSTPDITNRKILRGKVATTTAKEISFNYDQNQTATIKSTDTPFVYNFDGTTTVRSKFGNVEENDDIIALGLLDGTYLDTRTVFVLTSTE